MSNDFLFTAAADSGRGIVAVSIVGLGSAVCLGKLSNLSELDVLHWDGVDGHNLDNSLGFDDGGGGGSTGGCWGGARSGGSWCGLDGGITNNAVAFIVSDVSHNVLNTISGSESKSGLSIVIESFSSFFFRFTRNKKLN